MSAAPVSPADRVAYLSAELERHNHLYYVQAAPEITDREFDALLAELQALEDAHPALRRPDSPTQRVGGAITKQFAVFRHKRPMMSLANTYSVEELAEFDRRVREGLGRESVSYLCQLKIDGVALSLHYDGGILTHGVTRGDGTQGDDITANVRTIRGIPLRIPYTGAIEVRGEVYMTQSDFDALNRERAELGEAPLMNPRNTTAGTLKLQDSRIVAQRKLRFVSYYLAFDDRTAQLTSDAACIAQLKAWGFPVSDENELCQSLPAVLAYLETWRDARENLPFATDGVVVKVDELPAREELGATGKAPRWAVAYKYEAERARTVLDSVSFQVGRTGYITPVANLRPVLLAGTIVKRASLYNYDEIRRLDLHLGDAVWVEKSGEIIPKVVAVDKDARPADAHPVVPPSLCPECQTQLVQAEGEVGWYCPNDTACPPQVEGRLEHFASRRAMDINGLGSEIVAQLVRAGMVHSPADLYELTTAQLLTLERFGQKSADNLVAGIAASTQVPFHRVLYALGIRYVGEGVAQKLAEAFGNLDALAAASTEQIAAVYSIGDRIAQSVHAWFQEPANRLLIERLRSAGVQLQAAAPADKLSDKLAGKKVLLSGTFPVSRDDIKALVVAHGGENASGVSKNVDYFLVGDNVGPAKLEKATTLGVKMIDWQTFLAMLD